MTIQLLADYAGSAHALTIDHHGLLDHAARLPEIVAEAADNPDSLSRIVGYSGMDRARAAQERVKDLRATRPTATTSTAAIAGARSCTSAPTTRACASRSSSTPRSASTTAATSSTTAAATSSAAAASATAATSSAATTTATSATTTTATAATTFAATPLRVNLLQRPPTVIDQVRRKELQRQRRD
jgi:hypothetical protein